MTVDDRRLFSRYHLGMFHTDGIIGHEAQLRLLAAWGDHPAPGYLFVGPPHLGKHLIAERFVATLLGLDSLTLPAAHPDLIRLEAEEGKTTVSVERVREARLRLSEKPMVASRIVVFIPAMDRLNEEGMNALLKALEEPPAGAVFVCVSGSLTRIPATVRSRMVLLPFAPVPKRLLVEGLVARSVKATDAERLATESRGRPGLAIDPPRANDGVIARFLSAKTVGERLSLVDALAKDCDSSDNTVQAWTDALDQGAEAVRQTLSVEPLRAMVAAQGIITARAMVGGALSPRLALDAAALRLSHAEPTANLFPSHLPRAFPSIFLIPT
jgi:hypothetical protein